MANMAVYDKRHGDADRALFAFYRRDYIYRKNMWTRLSVAIGSMLLLVIYWLHQIFIYGIDLEYLDIQESVMESVLFLVAVMAVYTLIGTIQGTHQYYKLQKRVEDYIAMSKRLENMPDDDSKPTGGIGSTGESSLVYRRQIQPMPVSKSAPKPAPDRPPRPTRKRIIR